ncbi:MAG: 2-oxoacid:acceptor oxidoreductase subunit alpha [bacterium]
MRTRYSIKIAGQSGQGIDTVGKIVAKALKNAGFYVFGYREYPSLIKGGHATYQVDFSNQVVRSPSTKIDIVIVLNQQGVKWHLEEIQDGGIILHDTKKVRLTENDAKLLKEKNVEFIYVPALELALENGGTKQMSNTAILGFLWKLFGLPINSIASVILSNFAKKPEVADINVKILRSGFTFEAKNFSDYKFPFHPSSFRDVVFPNIDQEKLKNYFSKDIIGNPNASLSGNVLVSGNEAVSLGVIAGGVSEFFGYPMTPSSGILTFLAEKAHVSGMLVKQVEDEITAAGMVIGAMSVGSRALTATSGGGFDLMTEHLSLAGITEVPFVCVIGQRPGPGTGLPTWTTQADLTLAVYSGHGEFPRIVIAPKDTTEAFYLIQEAFNLTEKWQVPVLFLTDKFLAESLFLSEKFDPRKVKIERSVLDTSALTEEQKNILHRYADTENGVSPRWLPGTISKTYGTNSDEHDVDGNVIDDSDGANLMQIKRQKKTKFIEAELPAPVVYRNFEVGSDGDHSYGDICVVSWGSTTNTVLDAMDEIKLENPTKKISCIHYSYLWPLNVSEYMKAIESGVKMVIIEGNFQSELNGMLKMKTGKGIDNTLLKFDGRPFFVEEIKEKLNSIN